MNYGGAAVIRLSSVVGTINCSFCGKLIAQLGVDIRWFVEPGSMLRSAKGEGWQRVSPNKNHIRSNSAAWGE